MTAPGSCRDGSALFARINVSWKYTTGTRFRRMANYSGVTFMILDRLAPAFQDGRASNRHIPVLRRHHVLLRGSRLVDYAGEVVGSLATSVPMSSESDAAGNLDRLERSSSVEIALRLRNSSHHGGLRDPGKIDHRSMGRETTSRKAIPYCSNSCHLPTP